MSMRKTKFQSFLLNLTLKALGFDELDYVVDDRIEWDRDSKGFRSGHRFQMYKWQRVILSKTQ